MKLLRNPIVVLLLAVAAIWVVVSAARPKSRMVKSTRPTAAAAAKKTAPASTTNQTNETATVQIRPEKPIDLAYLEKKAPEWMEAPARDPFFAYSWLSQLNRQGTNPPVKLELSAIWRQTGGTFAVINGMVCSEGDTVEGFRVERIEDDRVILENGEWREVVRFPGTISEEPVESEYPEEPKPAKEESTGPVAGHRQGFGHQHST